MWCILRGLSGTGRIHWARIGVLVGHGHGTDPLGG